MSSPRTIKRYTDKWLELFNEFQADPSRVIEIECESEKEAMGLRLEFYKARDALARTDPEYYAALTNIDRKEVTVRGKTVYFGFKEANRASQLIEQALEKLHTNEQQRESGNGNANV